jgi:hypothetical protein
MTPHVTPTRRPSQPVSKRDSTSETVKGYASANTEVAISTEVVEESPADWWPIRFGLRPSDR